MFKSKTIKLFLMLFVIAFCLVGVVGCAKEKVTINFKFGEYSSKVEVYEGTVIDNDIIPFIKNKYIKLYYDEKYLNEYNNERINKSIDIYVKLNDEQDINNIYKACEAYFNKYIKSKREDAIIEDVILFEYLGTYNNVIVGVVLDLKHGLYLDYVHEITVEDIVFEYSDGYDIYAYDGNEFMDLLSAYNNSKLTYEDISNIYRLHTNG